MYCDSVVCLDHKIAKESRLLARELNPLNAFVIIIVAADGGSGGVVVFVVPLTTMMLNENQYFDVLSTDKWEWLDIFSWIYKYFRTMAGVCVFVYLHRFEKFEHSSSCEHNKLATIMLVS